MTQNEIIDELIVKGIVLKIGESYLITEKYKELLLPTIVKIEPITDLPRKVSSYDDLLNTRTNGSDWPIQVLEAKGRERASVVMNLCEVPATAPDGRYRLRGLNNDAVNVIGNFVESKDIDGKTFIEAVKLYYKHTETPKGFKNFVLEGDALEVYNEYITGDLLKNIKGGTAENPNEWR